MSGRCQSCRHWKPHHTGEEWGVRSFSDLPDAQKETVREAARTRFDDGDQWDGRDEYIAQQLADLEMGECALADMHNDELPTLARAKDGSEYMATLECHATFGCVQWEALTSPASSTHTG